MSDSMVKPEPSDDERTRRLDHQRAETVELSIYATITTIAILAASGMKNYVESFDEMSILALGSCLAVGIAHSWALVLMHRSRAEAIDWGRVILNVVAIFSPGIIVEMLSEFFEDMGLSVGMGIAITIVALSLLLAGVSGYSVRRGGATWLRTIGWAVASVAICAAVIIAKLIA